ncbi:MAG: MarR family transcriptional regulator [Micavibrio sp.]|nr:MAG: MarR family transcriptional regulator [Micavibrio sp.]
MDSPYYEIIHLIERLHRQFLDVLKVELERAGVHDINNVQSLVLHNIGDDEMTVGELTIRGYYLGSNVSYNVKKMVENGYLIQERSVHDKRSLRVRLSDKGRALNAALSDLYEKHEEHLDQVGFPQDKLKELNDNLKTMERFWASQMTGGNLVLQKAAAN